MIGALLDRRAAEEGLRRFGAEVNFRWETGSTNDDLKAAGKRRAFGHLVLLSVARQSAARGTRGANGAAWATRSSFRWGSRSRSSGTVRRG